MPEATDLQRVAQYVKSDRTAPSDVYNAACRMLDRPDGVEQLRTERDEAHSVAEKFFNIAINDGRVIESVRRYAAELRTATSPAGIAAVYADRLEELLPARAVKAPQSNGDGRAPQTLGTPEGQEAAEAQEAAQ
jgi:hypothetical protein